MASLIHRVALVQELRRQSEYGDRLGEVLDRAADLAVLGAVLEPLAQEASGADWYDFLTQLSFEDWLAMVAMPQAKDVFAWGFLGRSSLLTGLVVGRCVERGGGAEIEVDVEPLQRIRKRSALEAMLGRFNALENAPGFLTPDDLEVWLEALDGQVKAGEKVTIKTEALQEAKGLMNVLSDVLRDRTDWDEAAVGRISEMLEPSTRETSGMDS